MEPSFRGDYKVEFNADVLPRKDIDSIDFEERDVDRDEVRDDGRVGAGGGGGHDTIGAEANRAHVTLEAQEGADFNLGAKDTAHNTDSDVANVKEDFNSEKMLCRLDTLWNVKRSKETPILPYGKSPNQILHSMTEYMAGNKLNYTIRELAGRSVEACGRLADTATYQSEYAYKLVKQHGSIDQLHGEVYHVSARGEIVREDVRDTTAKLSGDLWEEIQKENPSAFADFYDKVDKLRFASDCDHDMLRKGQYRPITESARNEQLANLEKSPYKQDMLRRYFNEGPSKRCLVTRDALYQVAYQAREFARLAKF